MSDHDHGEDVDGESDGVPDSDPRHIDPAGDIADAFESGEIDGEITDVQDAEELREFVERAEAGELDLRADPGLEATVRIVRSMLPEDLDADTAAADPDSRD